jgi:hypothetical protein
MIFYVFAEKFCEKIGVFCSKQSYVNYAQNGSYYFFRKTPIFSQKIVIATSTPGNFNEENNGGST